VTLSANDLNEIENAVSKIEIRGDRYPAHPRAESRSMTDVPRFTLNNGIEGRPARRTGFTVWVPSHSARREPNDNRSEELYAACRWRRIRALSAAIKAKMIPNTSAQTATFTSMPRSISSPPGGL